MLGGIFGRKKGEDGDAPEVAQDAASADPGLAGDPERTWAPGTWSGLAEGSLGDDDRVAPSSGAAVAEGPAAGGPQTGSLRRPGASRWSGAGSAPDGQPGSVSGSGGSRQRPWPGLPAVPTGSIPIITAPVEPGAGPASAAEAEASMPTVPISSSPPPPQFPPASVQEFLRASTSEIPVSGSSTGRRSGPPASDDAFPPASVQEFLRAPTAEIPQIPVRGPAQPTAPEAPEAPGSLPGPPSGSGPASPTGVVSSALSPPEVSAFEGPTADVAEPPVPDLPHLPHLPRDPARGSRGSRGSSWATPADLLGSPSVAGFSPGSAAPPSPAPDLSRPPEPSPAAWATPVESRQPSSEAASASPAPSSAPEAPSRSSAPDGPPPARPDAAPDQAREAAREEGATLPGRPRASEPGPAWATPADLMDALSQALETPSPATPDLAPEAASGPAPQGSAPDLPRAPEPGPSWASAADLLATSREAASSRPEPLRTPAAGQPQAPPPVDVEPAPGPTSTPSVDSPTPPAGLPKAPHTSPDQRAADADRSRDPEPQPVPAFDRSSAPAGPEFIEVLVSDLPPEAHQPSAPHGGAAPKADVPQGPSYDYRQSPAPDPGPRVTQPSAFDLSRAMTTDFPETLGSELLQDPPSSGFPPPSEPRQPRRRASEPVETPVFDLSQAPVPDFSRSPAYDLKQDPVTDFPPPSSYSQPPPDDWSAAPDFGPSPGFPEFGRESAPAGPPRAAAGPGWEIYEQIRAESIGIDPQLQVRCIVGLAQADAPPGVADFTFYGRVVGVEHVECEAEYLLPDGSVASFVPTAHWGYMYRLREVFHLPGSGAWYSIRIRVTGDGQFEADYDYEAEPRFRSGPAPSAEDFRRDTAWFTRDEEHTPFWLRSKLLGL